MIFSDYHGQRMPRNRQGVVLSFLTKVFIVILQIISVGEVCCYCGLPLILWLCKKSLQLSAIEHICRFNYVVTIDGPKENLGVGLVH